MNVTIEEVLNSIKNYIESNTWKEIYFKSKGNDNGFEKLIEFIIPDIEKQFSGVTINLISGHHFPDVDIVINGIKFGLELKSSQRGLWAIPGNSILKVFLKIITPIFI